MTLSPSTLNELRDLVSAFLGPVAASDGPGAIVALSMGGELVHQQAVGLADINHGVPLGMHSLVRVASQTKQFTTLLLLMLERDGLLGLDDAVQQHLPWLATFSHHLSLRHLASNSSGLWDSFDLLTLAGVPPENASTKAVIMELLASQKELSFVPGSQVVYCNTNFVLLTEIIEKVSGRSYEDLLAERITMPLGMQATALMRHDAEAGRDRAAHYSKVNGAWHHSQWGMELTGEGGLVTSMHDLVLWQNALRRPPTGFGDLLARMSAEWRYPNLAPSPYGLGMVRGNHRGQRWLGHGGSVIGARSTSQYYPDADMGILVLANTDIVSAHELARQMADCVLGQSAQPEADDRLAGRAGIYRQQGGDDVFEIVEQGGRARFRSSNGLLGLEAVGDTATRPIKSVFDLTLASSASDDLLDANWCGDQRRYRRLPEQFTETSLPIQGTYRADPWGADLTIAMTAAGAHDLILRSRFGSFSAHLGQIDRDLYLVMGGADGQHPGRSWMATLKVEDGQVLITTDRSKRIPFVKHSR